MTFSNQPASVIQAITIQISRTLGFPCVWLLIGLPICSKGSVVKGGMFRHLRPLHSLQPRPTNQFCRCAAAAAVPEWSPSNNKVVSRRLFSIAPTCQDSVPSTIKDIALRHPRIAKVVLKKGKTQLFRDGSPMVYSGAVDCVVGKPPQTGDSVLVTDGARQPFAWGVYNSVSMFCVRIMQMEDEALRDPSCVLDMKRVIESRVAGAFDLRKTMDLPSKDTNVYRLVNSEGDRLSGLIADVLGDQIVVASSAAWVEKYRHTIEGALRASTGLDSITWRPSVEILKEDGLELDADDSSKPSIEHDLDNDEIEVIENGIRYRALLRGQKTGFYADQRDSRLVLRAVSRNKSVLDLCCYSGGFSLNAAAGGASHVTGVDSSGPAVELATANAVLNQLDPSSWTFVKADITPFLKEAIAEGKSWDVVVLDPPKLAPNKKALQRSLSRYRALNSLAMRVTKPEGLLMTCSCSGAMTQSHNFVSVLKVWRQSPCWNSSCQLWKRCMSCYLAEALLCNASRVHSNNCQCGCLQDASASVGRRLIQLRYAGAGSDHPLDVAYPEGEYLTNVLCKVL